LKGKIDRIITSEWFIAFLYRFNRIYSGTFRLTIENEKKWLDFLNAGGTVLLCTWHQQFFSAIRHFQRYKDFNPSLIISQSKDGKIVAGVAQRSGWHPVRGSSSRGGMLALKNMIANLKKIEALRSYCRWADGTFRCSKARCDSFGTCHEGSHCTFLCFHRKWLAFQQLG
jgi:lysophospholipid acyltransferase (LPLAT)-like uncharacterized protein